MRACFGFWVGRCREQKPVTHSTRFLCMETPLCLSSWQGTKAKIAGSSADSPLKAPRPPPLAPFGCSLIPISRGALRSHGAALFFLFTHGAWCVALFLGPAPLLPKRRLVRFESFKSFLERCATGFKFFSRNTAAPLPAAASVSRRKRRRSSKAPRRLRFAADDGDDDTGARARARAEGSRRTEEFAGAVGRLTWYVAL